MAFLLGDSSQWAGFLGQVIEVEPRILAGALGILLLSVVLYLLDRLPR